MIITHAPAKLNLTLEVLGKRPDGYHEIRSLMVSVGLHDTLMFEPARDISLLCNDAALQTEDNLVLRAARLLRSIVASEDGVRITLQKSIPSAAGLGGGSSDAAATLLALNNLWKLGLTPSRLSELGTSLGSDVPFFIYKGLALAEGRGERVTPLPFQPEFWFVVVIPPPADLDKKTARLYASLRPEWFTSGEHTTRLIASVEGRTALQSGDLYNVFENAAPLVFPSLEELSSNAQGVIGSRLHMAGSGPTLFALFNEEKPAREARGKLQARGLESIVTSAVYERRQGLPTGGT